jgi:hypothetical protein
MIIVIERKYDEPNPRGGRKLHKVSRKCFSDEDREDVEKFINEKSPVSGYEWSNIEYRYIKL